jgi:AcrR family transcriptional regulator
LTAVVGRPAYELEADDIVHAAIAILDEHGFDAVSMRNVSARLGVSPVPLYRRIGGKDALVEAMALHLFADLAPSIERDEPWQSYAERWALALRDGLRRVKDSRLLVGEGRSSFLHISRPLIESLRAGGLDADEAVQACRMLVWSTVGLIAVTSNRPQDKRTTRGARRPGSDPSVVTAAEADELFALHIRYLIEGIARDHESPTERASNSTDGSARRSRTVDNPSRSRR